MALSNTATPRYYGEFRDAVMRGEIPVCKEISLDFLKILIGTNFKFSNFI